MNTKTNKMTEGNPLITVLIFAVPMILSNLFQQLYNVIDTVIVGNRLGTDSLAAVGSAGSIIAVFVQLATGLALGGSIVIAQYFGAGKTDKIRLCTTTSTIFCGVVGLVSTVLIWLTAGPLLQMVNTPAEIMDLGIVYLRFYFLGCIPTFVYNALNGVYVALGNSKTPLRFLIISSVLNIVLDLVFIIVFEMGVGGAALATAISQAVACVMALIDVPKLLAEFEYNKKEPVFDWKLLGTMMRFALPSALQQSIVSVGSVVVQATINSFGAAVIAGSAAASKVINLAIAIPINYSNALSNYVGQNIGAGKEERIWPGLKSSLLCCGLISLVMTVILELFPEAIIRMFIQDDEANLAKVMEVGVEYIQVVGAFLLIFAAFMLIKSVFKGSGDMGWFIWVTLLSFFVRLVMTVGLAGVFGVGVIWWAFCVGWTIALFVTIGRYVHGGWKKKKIVG